MRALLLDYDENLVDIIEMLDPIRNRKINGGLTLEFDTSYKNVKKNYRILFQDNKQKWNEFIIRGIHEKHDSNDIVITNVFCEDSVYELYGDYIEDKRPYNVECINALISALVGTRWKVGTVESMGIRSTNFYHISVKEALHNILAVWQCEYETDITVVDNKITERKINIKKTIGSYTGKRFEYSKDLSEIERIINEDDIITALYGYGKGEEISDNGYGRKITFADINYGKAYLENNAARLIYGRNNPDGSKAHVFSRVDFNDVTDKAELKRLTQIELDRMSQIKVSYRAKIEALTKVGFDDEYVDLGDAVIVIDKDLDIRIKARVLELKEYLDNDSSNEIIIGNFIDNFANSFNSVASAIQGLQDKSGAWDKVTVAINTGNTDLLKNLIPRLNNDLNSSAGYVYLSNYIPINENKTGIFSGVGINVNGNMVNGKVNVNNNIITKLENYDGSGFIGSDVKNRITWDASGKITSMPIANLDYLKHISDSKENIINLLDIPSLQNDMLNFIKDTQFYTYNFANEVQGRFSSNVAAIPESISKVLLVKKDEYTAIDVYSYLSILHFILQNEVKKNDARDKKIEDLESRIKVLEGVT